MWKILLSILFLLKLKSNQTNSFDYTLFGGTGKEKKDLDNFKSLMASLNYPLAHVSAPAEEDETEEEMKRLMPVRENFSFPL